MVEGPPRLSDQADSPLDVSQQVLETEELVTSSYLDLLKVSHRSF